MREQSDSPANSDQVSQDKTRAKSHTTRDSRSPEAHRKASFGKTLKSSIALLIGVQSHKDGTEDFDFGLKHLLIICIICFILFFFGIVGVVSLIMANIESQ